MSDQPTEFSLFVAILFGEKGDIKALRMADSADAAKNFASNANKEEIYGEDSANKIDDENQENDLTQVDKLCSKLIDRVNKSIIAYHDLVFISSFMRPALAKSAIDNSVYSSVKAGGEIVHDGDDIKIYGLSSVIGAKVIKDVERMKDTDAGLKILPSSILLSLIATFDSIIGDSIRELLFLRPERLTESDKPITYRQLFEMGDIEQAKRKLIDDEVDRLLRGTHASQVEYIEKITGIGIAKHYSRWPNFLEIFERRNQVAHASGIATEHYIRRCNNIGYPSKDIIVGKAVSLKPRYLHHSIDIILEFGVLLSFTIWRKLQPDSEDKAFSSLNSTAFELIKKRRYEVSSWILDFALFKQKRPKDDEIVRMMILNLANCYKNLKKDELCNETLNSMSWNGVSDLLKIGKAAVENDLEAIVQLLPVLKMTGKLSGEQFRDWPIFDGIRTEEKVAAAFEEIYGEALIIEVAEPKKIEETQNTIVAEGDTGTVH